jgi:hypothetical protein
MSGSTASEPEREGQENDSVFDFLYHDARRVGSFLAQFDKSGHLQQVKQTESVGRTSSNKAGMSGSGGVPLVAQGAGSAEHSWARDGREGAERVYDPLWANALALLDFLTEADMIKRDIGRARIGGFVLFSGVLTIVDLSMMKGVWEIPVLKKSFTDGVALSINKQENDLSGNRHERRLNQLKQNTEKKNSAKELEMQVDGILQLLKLLPHAVQARVTNENGTTVWSNLREDCLVISTADLALKHGPTISGEWNVLGILDAEPDVNIDGPESPSRSQVLALAALADSPFAQSMAHLSPFIRQLGRPATAHGITPILIFRKVS